MDKKVLISGSVVLVALTASVTYALTYNVAMNKFNQVISEVNERQAMYKKLNDIDQTVRQDYLGEINENDLMSGLSVGYISGLKNSKARYLDKEYYNDYITATNPNSIFLGISTEQTSDGELEVVYIQPGSLAEQNEFENGDIIVKIEGKNVSDIGYEKAVNKLYGQKNQKVSLTIKRINSENKSEEIAKTIKFNNTPDISIDYEVLQNKIGYIKINRFDSTTQSNVVNALKDMEKDTYNVILDLRDLSGGDYEVMAKVADVFLPKADIISSIDKDGLKEVKYHTNDGEYIGSINVIVNDATSGPAEILAYAIRDSKKGVIIGQNTAGSIELLKSVKLSDGSGIIIPSAYYVTKSGSDIRGTGLTPDVEVVLSSEHRKALKSRTIEQSSDNQLLEAINRLNS